MQNKNVVIDSGPLIALFDKNDSYHRQAMAFTKAFRGQFLSTYPVITEVTHLLDFSVQVQLAFLRWVAEGGIRMMEILPQDLFRILELSEKYSDIPMDFTDASLVTLCERLKIKDIVSIDGDFLFYRTRDKKRLNNIFLA